MANSDLVFDQAAIEAGDGEKTWKAIQALRDALQVLRVPRQTPPGNGAAGVLELRDLNGVPFYVWVDATGALRIGPARPTPDGVVSDTSGALV